MTTPRLYDLLPAYVRFRDAYQGEPLRAVMEALELPFEALAEDLRALYDGWFIETCDLWRVPYVGDLLGVRGLDTESQLLPTQRNRVANALAYRRAKGTAAALERVARDATGWECHLVEFPRTTAAAASLRTASAAGAGRSGGTVDLRRTEELESLDGPFNVVAHTADLLPPPPGPPPLGDRRGFHPRQLGLVFYRLGAAPVQAGRPFRVGGADGGWRRYTFHPMGLEQPLFNPPRSDSRPVHRSRRDSLPAPLRRSDLAREVAVRRRGGHPLTRYLDRDEPALRIVVRERDASASELLAAHELGVCDLGEWRAPGEDEEPGAAAVRAWVDPERGRLLRPPPPKVEPASEDAEGWVWVDYYYGAGLDVGGGAFPRRLEPPPGGADRWTAVVAKGEEPRYDAERRIHYFNSLTRALEAWNHHRVPPIPPPRPLPTTPRDGVIHLTDSATYGVRAPVLLLGRRLLIQAAEGCTPTLRGTLRLVGPERREAAVWAVDSPRPSLENRLTLDGLWVEGGVEIAGSASLDAVQCTLDPPRPGRPGTSGIRVAGAAAAAGYGEPEDGGPKMFNVRLRRSVCGALRFGSRKAAVELEDCIVDGEVELPDGQLQAVRSTLLGPVRAGRLPLAVDTLFAGRVEVELASRGRLLTSAVPEGSRTPPRERCVLLAEGTLEGLFNATAWGSPAYVQLAAAAPPALHQGASNGNEIGVYNGLRQGDRLANLRAALDEYLPWGMTARVGFAT
jgi:hypothetical protein